jgi:phospholipid/cholesterol/gamma-HCH transport system substrate-binding protein
MKKYSMETAVGIFVVIGFLCVGYMTVKLGNVSLLGGDTYVLQARFATVSGLKIGSPVEIYGIQVGRVDKLEIDPQKQLAWVELGIRNGINVYDDGSASIKTAGLIGDKFIKVDPGGSGNLLKPGGTITETSSALDIEDLIGRYAFGEVKKDVPGSNESTK